MRINKSGAIIQKLSADDYIVRNVEQFWWMTKKKVLREQIELMLYIYGPSTSTRHCSVRLSPIAENSPLLPPVESGPCLSPSVADHPLGPATDHRLEFIDTWDDGYKNGDDETICLPWCPNAFASMLSSLSNWKLKGKRGVWLKLLSDQACLVPIAMQANQPLAMALPHQAALPVVDKFSVFMFEK
ncbi:hypothetical protein V6N11_066369 [Hibiscus sabdariffa]|uniref:Pre-nudix hydrolase domain-containing protein n=1 Tax=Hibiscus sabdariffa TaxID=183260 RepID=A0ABR2NFN0_9ROSI